LDIYIYYIFEEKGSINNVEGRGKDCQKVIFRLKEKKKRKKRRR
jgi:hypothetical protein